MSRLYDIIRPFLFRMDAESAHSLTLKALKAGLGPKIPSLNDPALETVLWDRKFPNPVGLAAGFDKNAEVISPMLNCGFGFVETGTVTPKPQAGNPRPRIFRDAGNESIINAMGFPNGGLTAFKRNFEKFLDRRPRPAGIVGINIGMNKDQDDPVKDYRLLVHHLGPLADYMTVNISSPNTPGLRDLQKRDNLLPLLESILNERAQSCGSVPPPILVKLSPDLEPLQKKDIATALLESGIDGLILTNTTTDRPSGLPAALARRKGGLSGRLLKDKATQAIRDFYALTGGRLPVIAAGGIFTADDAYEKICAGASLLQLYTALVYRGPNVVSTINKGLVELLKRDGFSRIDDAVGAAHKKKADDKKSAEHN